MQNTLTSSMITALLSAICYGCAKNIYGVTPGWIALKTVLVWCGVVFGIYAIAGGILVVLDHLSNPLYAFGDVLERLAHPEIALVTAFGKLSPEQLDAYMYQSGELLFHLDEKGSPDWSIEMNHRRLSSHWVRGFLYKSEKWYPDFPPVSAHTDKSKINADEIAMRNFLRATKRIVPRPGMKDVWVDGHSPKTVRADYFEVA